MNSTQLTEQITDPAKGEAIRAGVIGTLGAGGGWIASIKAATALLQFFSALFACSVGAWSAYKIFGPKIARAFRAKTPAVAFVLIFATGCTNYDGAVVHAQREIFLNKSKLEEQSRANTTGIVDSLTLAPTNPPTALALRLAKADQQLEGMPLKRIDVAAILAGHKHAIADLETRLKDQEALLAENAALKAKLDAKEAALIDMGKKYEAERNTRLSTRIRRAITGTLICGGLVALLIFCPPAFIALVRFAGWIVSKIPAAAKLFGVVTKPAWDATVSAIEKAKPKMGEAAAILESSLSREMDKSHKALVRATKPQLA